jgi:hypothetical protein
MTPADHMERIASLGCIVCHTILGRYAPANVHHIGDSSERSDWLTIPLCQPHHQGPQGFHGAGERAFNRMYKTNELMLLGETIKRLTK